MAVYYSRKVWTIRKNGGFGNLAATEKSAHAGNPCYPSPSRASRMPGGIGVVGRICGDAGQARAVAEVNLKIVVTVGGEGQLAIGWPGGIHIVGGVVGEAGEAAAVADVNLKIAFAVGSKGQLAALRRPGRIQVI